MKSPSSSRLKESLKNELDELLNDCKDSPYWKRKPKPREYKIEHEKVETYYDNLVIQSLKDYDNICGQKFGEKVCFQKHCSHNHKKEEQIIEQHDEIQTHNEIFQEENISQHNSFNLLIEAINFIENQKEETREIIKLVDYDSTDDEIIPESPDTIMSEIEEEMIKGQAPLYLPLEGFFHKNI